MQPTPLLANDPSVMALQDAVTGMRRHIHAHPELRFEEAQTAGYVAALLNEWGINVERGIGGHGLVGVLKNGNSKASIGLRADMDALPVQELNTFAHASRFPGKMHACGHDGHTAMLLGAARYLAEHRTFDGTINFIFQPAEEGGAGARRMIEDGLFERFPMDAVFGAHNWPGMDVGHFGVREGGIMASSNTFTVNITGRGAHAAQPQRAADPVMVAVHLAQAWQTIVSRNVDPHASAVLSITQIHAGSAANVIADTAMLNGTVRTFSMDALDLIEQRMRTIAEGVALAFDVTIDFDFLRLYPPLINHAREAALAARVMRTLGPDIHVDDNVSPAMTAEDFSFYMQHKPGCYVFIGNGQALGGQRLHGHADGLCQLHSASYDFNDALLPLGIAWWVNLARTWLAEQTASTAGA